MSVKIEYPYDRGKLLEQRNTYFYTQYMGLSFLKAWQGSRQMVQEKTAGESEILVGHAVPCDSITALFRLNEWEETQTVFQAILAGISGEREEKIAAETLAKRLLKKFEVTKRVHQAYNRRCRPKDPGAYKNLALYVRCAEMFEAAYAGFDSLPFLNGLLKCMDILCAYSDTLCSTDLERTAQLIIKEKDHVKLLADRVEVLI